MLLLSAFSVKKPMTVFVAVVLVIILGFVAFDGMTTDLLPNIDLPYVIVVTAYPGADPETVETELSSPIEQSMATLEGIDSVSSTSSENYSMVMLQFEEKANMDTITGDIREKLNLIDDSWDDMVSNPIIMKINPDMLPVTVAAVEREGMGTIRLSEFVNDELMQELRGVDGVAQVTASGVVTQKLTVSISEELVKEINAKVKKAIDDGFAEGEEKIATGETELESGMSEVESGISATATAKTMLDDKQAKAAEELARAELELDAKAEELANARLQIIDKEKQLLDQKEQLQTTYSMLTELATTAEGLENTIARANAYISAYDRAAEYDALIAETSAAHPELTSREEVENWLSSNLDGFDALRAENAEDLIVLAASGGANATVYAAQNTAKNVAEASLSVIDSSLASYGTTRAEIPQKLLEIEGGVAEIDTVVTELENTLAKFDAGGASMDEALLQLREASANAAYGFASGVAQILDTQQTLASAKAQLESGRSELDSAKEQLETAKRDAYSSADMTNVVTVNTVSAVLYAQNFSMPAGYAEDETGERYLVRVGDKLTYDDIRDLVLFDPGMEGLDPIRLSDVANIAMEDDSADIYSMIDGSNGILISFSKQSNYSTSETSKNIREAMDELSQKYDGLRFVPLMDQGSYIEIVVSSVLDNLYVGAALAILILLFFLWDIRPTFMIACSIPVSLLFAITLMYFSGVTLNVISLSGLAVAVGMLVDNSIVVIENIYRMRQEGMPVKEAAKKGAAEVAAAVTSSTLTTVCVFAPIVFIDGLTRQLFQDMALTMTYSLVASLIVALTLVPAMSTGMLRRDKKTKAGGLGDAIDRGFAKLRNAYAKTLSWMLGVKPLIIVFTLVLLLFSIYAGFSRGFCYMPEMAATELMVSVDMGEDAKIEDTREICDELTTRIRAMDGVTTVGAALSGGVASVIGLSASGASDPSSVTMYVLVDGKAEVYGLENDIANAASDLPCEVTVSGSSTMTSFTSAMGGSGVTVRLYSDDLDDLLVAARDSAELLEGIDGLVDVTDGIGETTPEIRIIVDREKAMEYGLTVAEVYQEVASLLAVTSTATSVKLGSSSIDVSVENSESGYATVYNIKESEIFIKDGKEENIAVELKDICDIIATETMASISHQGQRRTVEVAASAADGTNLTALSAKARNEFAKHDFPDSVSYEFTGENESVMDAMKDLVGMLALGIVMIYLIMVAQFQSLLSPFIVMFTIPLAFTGGLLALAICGYEVSIVSMIGFVMLVGIIVNNGIVLIDYANLLRSGGKTVRSAIVEAGRTRLRPVMMTALTTLLGLLPLAMGRGYGADLIQPVAVVCIGGLLYATLMTLFVVPIIYDSFMKDTVTVEKTAIGS